MPNVSQSIPSYLGGISQQADYDMSPGYLKDIINAYPDITYGLRKRPGLRYEFPLGAEADYAGGYWFSVAQNDRQPCIGVVVPGDRIYMWNVITQQPLTTTSTFGYIAANDKPFPLDRESYAHTTFSKGAIILNRNVVASESATLTPGSITGRVTTYGDLAEVTASEGNIYEITNAPNVEEDNFFVIYTNGAWEECARPGISDGIDDSTMPHIVTISEDSTAFSFIEIDSKRRSAGDMNTNGNPSFVGAYIHNVFLYLNRVGYLSKDNIYLSAPLVPDNITADITQEVDYLYTSVLAGNPADPIDLNVASTNATSLISVLPAIQGLIIFGTNEQFMLYSDSGVVTPTTSVIKSISTFEINSTVNSVKMGDDYYFISKTQRNTRVFQLVVQGIERAPVLTDVGKIITDYIPNDVDSFGANSQNQFISMSSSTDNKMYMYRMYKENNEILFNAWFTWELIGNIQLAAYINDRFFSVVSTGGELLVSSASLNLVPEEDQLTNVPFPDSIFAPGVREGIGPFLDLWISNATTRQITVTPDYTLTDDAGNVYWYDLLVTFPSDYPSQIADAKPLVVKTREALTRNTIGAGVSSGVGFTVEPIVNADGTWTIPGEFALADQPQNWVAGYRFNYNLLFPKTYLRSDAGNDWEAYTTISRYKFIFKEVSDLKFQIKKLGSPEWTDARSITPAGFYQDNTSPSTEQFTIDMPIHQRNSYFDMRLISDSPFPVTLSRMMWEGFYNPKYYRRY